MSADKTYTIQTIGGRIPTQATGRTSDDRPYYFRARHGEWVLEIGLPGWPTDVLDWPKAGAIIAEGDDTSEGTMGNDEVKAILDKYLW